MTAQDQFVGILHFPWPLPVRGAALGTAHSAIIGDESILITLPTGGGPVSPLASSLGFESLDVPGGVEIAPALLAAVNRSPGWGYQAESDRYEVYAASASSSGPVDPSKISHVFHDWFAAVRDWVSAWLGIPSIELGTSRATAMSWLRADGSYTGEGGVVGSVIRAGSPAVDAQTLNGAFKNASSGTPLPAEHRLLLQARNSMWTRDVRAGVIDAGTAAEVALGASIQDELAGLGVPQDFITKAIEAANGVVGLHDFQASLGHPPAVSRSQVMDQLANRRNKAAHAGQVPSDVDCGKALNTATAIVNAARPMPTP